MKRKDRHLTVTPVIVTASREVVAGRRRIEAFKRKNPDTKIVVQELHHYAMLAFLHVARDDEGHLHLATTTCSDENDWTSLS